MDGAGAVSGWAGESRLAAFRGDFPAAPLPARRVAGLLDVPGCVRRQVLDAAAVPMDPLAVLLGALRSGRARSRSPVTGSSRGW